MKISNLLVSLFLSWVAYDLNLFRRRQSSLISQIETVSLTVNEIEQREAQQAQRQRLDVIPKRYRSRRPPLRSKCNYFSTKPRDVRFSDQRKIRRMINNA